MSDLAIYKEKLTDLLCTTKEVVEEGIEVLPTAFVFKEDKVDQIIGLAFNADTKKQMLRSITDKSAEAGIDLIAVVMAAYVLKTSNKGEVEGIDQVGGLKHYPGREEALIVSLLVDGKIASMGTKIYHRTPTGVEWEELVWVDVDKDRLFEERY